MGSIGDRGNRCKPTSNMSNTERVYNYIVKKLGQGKTYVNPSWAEKDLQIGRQDFIAIIKSLRQGGYITVDWSQLKDKGHICFGYGQKTPSLTNEASRYGQNPMPVQGRIENTVNVPVQGVPVQGGFAQNVFDLGVQQLPPLPSPQMHDVYPIKETGRREYTITERDRRNLDLLDWLFNGMREKYNG